MTDSSNLPKIILDSLNYSSYSKSLLIENPKVDSKLSNLWHSPQRRKKFQHLSNNPSCVCGAGDDIQFLYTNDEMAVEDEVSRPVEKSRRRKKKVDDKTMMKIPEKLVTKELSLVQHSGVDHIHFVNEPYSTTALEHINHKVAFPSLHPNKVKPTQKTLEHLKYVLDKIDFDNLSLELLPTSLHRLLSIVKKEQDLYNTIFYNIIKETTVDCIERGELLANIRQRYRDMFVQVPKSIKNYHDNIVVGRILDRRLSEELKRFQKCVLQLSNELEAVKQHELGINQLCQKTKNELNEAVEETRTNADLLREYYGLYEFQRRRLEKAVKQLDEERIAWRNATYEFTSLVLKKYDMTKGFELVDNEKCWYNSSGYFVQLLSDSDSKLLGQIRQKTNLWQKEIINFMSNLKKRDLNIGKIIDGQIQKLVYLEEELEEEFFNEKGQLDKNISRTQTESVYNSLLAIEETLSNLTEQWSGNIMLKEEEKLSGMKRICGDWSELAITVFNRHRVNEEQLYPEHVTMLDILQLIEQLHNQVADQLTGDNGVIDGIATVQNYLENWIARLAQNLGVTAGMSSTTSDFYRPLPDQEWTRFKLLLPDWLNLIKESRNAIGQIVNPIKSKDSTNRNWSPEEVIQQVGSWSQRSANSVESENQRLHETIDGLHQQMVRWAAHIFLRLAPDHPGNSPEARRAAKAASVGIREIFENQELMSNQLDKTTALILSCTKDVVSRGVMEKIEKQLDNVDEDVKKLDQLKIYSTAWITSSKDLLKNMMEQEYDSQIHKMENRNKTMSSAEATSRENTGASENTEEVLNVSDMVGNLIDQSMEGIGADIGEEEESEEGQVVQIAEGPDRVLGIGIDTNIHWKYLVQDPDSNYQGDKFGSITRLLGKENGVDLPRSQEAHKIIRVFEVLQEKLKELSKESEESSYQCHKMEMDLTKTKDALKLLQDRYSKVTEDLKNLQEEKSKELGRPALLSAENTIERAMSRQESEKSSKSTGSSKKRAPPRRGGQAARHK